MALPVQQCTMQGIASEGHELRERHNGIAHPVGRPDEDFLGAKSLCKFNANNYTLASVHAATVPDATHTAGFRPRNAGKAYPTAVAVFGAVTTWSFSISASCFSKCANAFSRITR